MKGAASVRDDEQCSRRADYGPATPLASTVPLAAVCWRHAHRNVASTNVVARRVDRLGAHVQRVPGVRLFSAGHVTRAPAEQLAESVLELLLHISTVSS